MKLFKQQHFLYAITGAIILVAGIIFSGSELNINVHDTYIVISYLHLAIAHAFLFLFFSLICFIFFKSGKSLQHTFGFVHYFLTTLTLLIISFPPTFLFPPYRYSPGNDLSEPRFDVVTLMTIAVLFFMFAQLLFLFNIVWTLFRRKNT